MATNQKKTNNSTARCLAALALVAVGSTASAQDAGTERNVLFPHLLGRWQRLIPTEVGVAVTNRIVTLTGTVDSWGRKMAAAAAAHRVVGVLDVASDVVVRVMGSAKKSDSEIAQQVRHALAWDVFVPDEQIRSTVSNGVVTLEVRSTSGRSAKARTAQFGIWRA
jgi:osmotically-inducible protein OsmY